MINYKLQADAERQAREELLRQLRRTQVAFISCVSICIFVLVKRVNGLLHLAREELVRQPHPGS
jgi:chemotaxis receptor (MCP) glutamine deamidase CheD